MVDRREENQRVLKDAEELQSKTKDSVFRIQRQIAESETVGAQTLEELRRQGQQTDDITGEVEATAVKLDQSMALQNTFDRWAGNWLGGKKSKAMKEASAEISLRNQEEQAKVKEVFQHEKFDTITRTWKKAGLVLCTNPTVSCDDVFDPETAELSGSTSWIVDFSLSKIDGEGWTYAYDFSTLNKSGAGDVKPQWNSYVRRRKWKYNEKKFLGGNEVDAIRERQAARAQGGKGGAGGSAPGSSKMAEKIAYVPRSKQPTALTASGLTSAGMVPKNGDPSDDQTLDDESKAGLGRVQAADAEIDAGIDAISSGVDNLNQMAKVIRDETLAQNAKLDRLDMAMQRTQEKQTIVNARQRYLLK